MVTPDADAKPMTATAPNTPPKNDVPVLLTDFDGVFHALAEPVLDESFRLIDNPRLFLWVPILCEILAPFPDVKIIVSSDWRRIVDDENLVRLLGPVGNRFVGVMESYGGSRADEIKTEVRRRNLTRWLAIDDHPTVQVASRKNWRFIPCHPESGLSCERVQQELEQKLSRLRGKD